MTSSMEVNYYFLMIAKDRHCLVKILKEKKKGTNRSHLSPEKNVQCLTSKHI